VNILLLFDAANKGHICPTCSLLFIHYDRCKNATIDTQNKMELMFSFDPIIWKLKFVMETQKYHMIMVPTILLNETQN